MSHASADDRAKFLRFTSDLPKNKQLELFEYIKDLRENLNSMTDCNLRLRALLVSCAKVSSSLVFD